jgi:peptide/nickel transport system substrate-binding protein
VHALDRFRVRFTIEGSSPTFPRYLCFGTAAIVDSREATRHATASDPWAGDYLATTPCGFGAFDLADQDERRLRLVPLASFWAGAPPIAAVEYRAVASREEGLALFAQGEANALVGLSPDEALRVAALPGVQLLQTRTNHAVIEFNHHRPPFAQRDVREAVLRTIPYQRVIEEDSLGFARRQTDLYQPNTPGDLNGPWPYSPGLELSRALVSRAGMSGSRVVPATVASPEADRIAAIIREALAPLGLVVAHRHVAELAPGEQPDLFLRDACSHGIADRRDAAWVPLSAHTYLIALREPLHPWFLSREYLPLTSLHWNAARSFPPPYR